MYQEYSSSVNKTGRPMVAHLVEFGLSEKEARTYLALLELEVATAAELAKQSGVNRSSTYVVIEALNKKGLVGTSRDKSIRRFFAVSPDTLGEAARSMAYKQKELKDKIEALVPELKALHKGAKRRPVVRIFEGKEGLINVLSMTLQNKEKIFRYSSSAENLMREMPDFIEKMGQMRVAAGIEFYSIMPKNSQARTMLDLMPRLYKTAFIPKNKFRFSADFGIWDDKVGLTFIGNKDVTTVLIENADIAENMKILFDMAFEEARRIGEYESDL